MYIQKRKSITNNSQKRNFQEITTRSKLQAPKIKYG